jgi:hypothetical protein
MKIVSTVNPISSCDSRVNPDGGQADVPTTQLTPAGLRARIQYWDARIQQQSQDLQHSIAEMNHSLQQLTKELNAQDNIQDNHTPG